MSLPFTPKFRDLVRTYTTTSGTAPFVPGSAVQGFSTFAEMLSAGDQFYYCAQAAERPGEREVGRGTLRSDGSIAREAVEGALTSFGPGVKTISLVAAAEWFTRVGQGTAGVPGGGGADSAVPSRAELAAQAVAGGRAAILSEQGREGLFVFDPADRSALVACDPAQGLTVAPEFDRSGTRGAWVRRYDGAINVAWFGAAGDDETDDLAAFKAALAAMKGMAAGRHSGTLFIPASAKPYYLSGTLNLHQKIDIAGAGRDATILRFANNCNGVVFNEHRTDNDVGTAGQNGLGDSGGSTLQNVTLWGGAAESGGGPWKDAANKTGHGIRIRSVGVKLSNLSVLLFAQSGVHIIANSGDTNHNGYNQGNANQFSVNGVDCFYNGGDGFTVAGTDANAGVMTLCNATSNAGAGFREYSFLGNSYVACHTRDNGVEDPTGADQPTGTCAHDGAFYYVVAGREGQATTEVPGSVSDGAEAWRRFNGHPHCKTWTVGKSWVAASPYLTNPANVNGRNVFNGCYAESAQPPVQATAPTLFVGGLLDEVGVAGSASWVRGTAKGGVAAGEFLSPGPSGVEGSRFGAPDGQTIFEHFRSGVSARLGADTFGGGRSLTMLLNNSFRSQAFGLDPGFAYGAGSSVFADLHVGDGTVNSASRLRRINALADLDGRVLRRGDTFLHTDGTIYRAFADGSGPSTAVVIPVTRRSPVVRPGPEHTASLTDANGYLRFSSATAAVLTVPPNTLVPFPLGTVIEIEQAGAGTLTVAGGPGVTINSRGDDLTLAGQHAVAALKKVDTDTWILTGDL